MTSKSSAPVPERDARRSFDWLERGFLASSLTAAATVVDVAFARPFSLWSVALAAAVGLALGASIALPVSILSQASRRLHPWAIAALWGLVGGATTLILTADLEVWGKLEGNKKVWALSSLGASLLGGLTLGLHGAFVTSRLRARRLYGPRFRYGLVALGVLVILGTIVVDRFAYPWAYRGTHRALRGMSIAHLTLFVWGLAEWSRGSDHWLRSSPRLRRYGIAFVALSASAIAVTSGRPGAATALLQRPFAREGVELVRALTDVDRDRYSSLLGGGDCAPWNATIGPGTREIPANSVDDNCRRGDAPVALDVASDAEPNLEPSGVDVVVITIDTLRPDRMSIYDGPNETTPNIAAWASRATRFDRAYTSGGWTSLALPSLLYGVYPRRLGWTLLHETSRFRLLREPLAPQLREGERAMRAFALPLEEKRRSVPMALQARGMRTIAILDDGYTGYFDKSVGGFRGFDEYVEVPKNAAGNRGDEGTTRTAIRSLERAAKGKPFFAWVHYFGPHAPTTKHPGTPEFGDSVADGYDHEIAYVDEQVGALLGAIEALPKKRPTLLVLTADHGEEFSLSGRYHGQSLNEGAIRIPLVVQGPGFEPGASDGLVSLVDVAPTIMAATKTKLAGLDGVSLLSPRADDRVVLCDTWRFTPEGGMGLDQTAAIGRTQKVVYDLKASDVWLAETGTDARLGPPTLAPGLVDAAETYLEATHPVTIGK